MGRFRATFRDDELMNFISRNPGCTTNKLCERFNVTRQDIHHRMRKLMKKGFILIEVGRGRVPSKYFVTNNKPWRSRRHNE